MSNWVDGLMERLTRQTAGAVARRSAIAKMGKWAVVGAVGLPVLPFDRSGNAHAAGSHAAGHEGFSGDDPTNCDYWRYCALDGYLCSCCGGSVDRCPPGTEASKLAWVGTCRNPKDGKDYLISYSDCCGNVACGQCACNGNVRERPGYRMGLHNDINWCMVNTSSSAFHCTTGIIVGIAE